jgi:hypothetical protein
MQELACTRHDVETCLSIAIGCCVAGCHYRQGTTFDVPCETRQSNELNAGFGLYRCRFRTADEYKLKSDAHRLLHNCAMR